MQQVALDPMNQFQLYLRESAPDIDHKINLFLSSYSKKTAEISPKLTKFLNLFKEASKGGKRIRGVLVKLGYELGKSSAVGSPKTVGMNEILKVAAAFEIFQTAILAHDDVIDQSDLRRGRPTIYKQLGGDHYAISQTIALGDAAFFLAIQLINESDFPVERKNRTIKIFNEMMLRTCLGQMLDIEIPHQRKDFNEGKVLKIAEYKSAWYTIIGPLSIGAILAGADDNKLLKIKEFGKNLGVAFQIQDDLLGVFGSSDQTGKSTSSDIEEGKATLLISYALKEANKEQKHYLITHYGQKVISQDELEKIRQIFIDTKSFDFCKKKCVEYAEAAKMVIHKITNQEKMAKLLLDMSDFLIERNT